MDIYNLSFNGICKSGVYFFDNYINPLILIQNAFSDNDSIRETHRIMTKTFRVFVCVKWWMYLIDLDIEKNL